MHLEWNPTEHFYVWRIYSNGVRTSAYIPYKENVKPQGVSDREYAEGLKLIEKEDEELF